MKIQTDDFRAKPDDKTRLKELPTRIDDVYKSKEHYLELLDKHIEELSELQALLYADNRHSLLLIFQAMDAAGKDGLIKHVMSGINPQGCRVSSFKQPSDEALAHDFLWRTTRRLPERGQIGIFNRSYYEEVLIVRVHPEILAARNLPGARPDKQSFWDGRYRSIVEFEAHLQRSGTKIVKIFLHLSKEEQRERFIARIDEPDKNWKFSEADLKEREYWEDYMKAYEQCIQATSTKHAPWFVVPADDKKNARLIVSKVILETLRDFTMEYPKTSEERARELESIRNRL